MGLRTGGGRHRAVPAMLAVEENMDQAGMETPEEPMRRQEQGTG